MGVSTFYLKYYGTIRRQCGAILPKLLFFIVSKTINDYNRNTKTNLKSKGRVLKKYKIMVVESQTKNIFSATL